MLKLISVIVLYTASIILKAQTISNVQAVRYGNDIVITYNLECDSISSISLYTSDDGGKKWIGPLKSVTGDVGDVKSAGNKHIVWNVTQEIEIFAGDNILFRVIGQGYISIGSFIDQRDRISYNTIMIGKQNWMAENLNFVIDGSWCYDNNKEYCLKYGRLYTWETAKTVCPSGWHLPSDIEWNQLTDYLGGELSAGNKLKSQLGWEISNYKLNSNNGFSALPGGFLVNRGSFIEAGRKGAWWSSTEYNSSDAFYRILSYDQPSVKRLYFTKSTGLYVRCIKD